MKTFIFLTVLKIIYYLFIALSIILNLSVYGKFLPIALIFLTSVAFQISLLAVLKKRTQLIIFSWIIFTCVELVVVACTLIYIELVNHYYLFFPTYLILKFYSIFRVLCFNRDVQNDLPNSEYQTLL